MKMFAHLTAPEPTRWNLPVDYTKLTWQERREVRQQYIQQQKGLCYHCKQPLNEKPPEEILEMEIDWDRFPEGFLTYNVHLHHHHVTNATLGAVHSYCNAVLFQYHGE